WIFAPGMGGFVPSTGPSGPQIRFPPGMSNPGNLSRSGPGRTRRTRVYVGCLLCAQALWVADIEHANRWLETHWRRCKRSLPDADGQVALSADGKPILSPRLWADPSNGEA